MCTTATAAATPAIVTDTATIIGANTVGPYWVSGFFIVAGSEKLSSNSSPSIEHSLNPNDGRITFDCAITPADTITVTFQRLGFALRSRWSLENSPDEIRSPEGVIPVSYVVPSSSLASPLRSLPAPTRLQWQGHKSFSVTASEGTNADWSQGMELSVEGELLDGLRLSAALSDKQIGSGSRYSSGDGSRLGDLDRFFIEAQSSHFRGRLGEMLLQQTGTAPRRVSGIQTHISGTRHSFESFIARPQGETRHSQIKLRESVLGPYTLSGTSAKAIIVDGSQSVWLDGDQLTEGRDADYTIDATRGTISLTPRVHFSNQSQLIVEYEITLDSYQRTMAGLGWDWHDSDTALTNSLSVGWEGDDPSRSLYGDLTSAQRDLLAHVSDGQVQMPASEHVGDHEGDYNLEVRPNGDSVFVYAGPDQGEWDVRFQWAGDKKGSYRHLVDQVYEYVGPKAGSYEPTLTLTAPASQAVIDETLRFTSARFGRFNLDWQGIGIDQNRLSNGSASTHSNHALSWNSQRNKDDNQASAALSWISQSQSSATSNFGVSLAQFSEDWRLHSDLLDHSYDDHALTARVPVRSWLSTRLNAGHFTQAHLDGTRASGVLEIKPTQSLLLQQQMASRWVNGSGSQKSTTLLNQSLVRYQPGSLGAEAGWRSEDVDDPTRQFTYDSDANFSRWLSLSHRGIVARQEWRRTHDIDLNRDEHTTESSIGLAAAWLHASSGSGLTAVRGDRSLGDGSPKPYYGGRLNSVWSLRDNLQLSADMDLTHRNAGSQREVFLPTRPGQGDYRYERGEYIPDPQGDYRRVFVDDDDSETSAYDASKNTRVSWHPTWQGVRWTIDAARRIDARYSTAQFAPTEWLIPWSDLTGDLLPGARLSLRDDHRLSVQPRAQSRATVTLAHEHQLSRPLTLVPDDNQQSWRIESEWREEINLRSYVSAAIQYNRRTRGGSLLSLIDSDARALLAAFGYSPATGVGLALETRRRLDREFNKGQALDLWGIRPSARVGIAGISGSLSTDFTWLDGDVARNLSPLLAEGRPLGFSFTESAEVRWQLPSRISLNARISGDHRPHEADRWRMHIETVATF